MSEQARPELLEFYQRGAPGDIAAWIERSIHAFKTAFADFRAEAIRIELVNEPYPTSVEEGGHGITDILGKHTLSVAFTLAYSAGVCKDVDMVESQEVVLNTLASMHFHYNVVYGIIGRPGQLPYLVVRVPSSASAHVAIRFVPNMGANDPLILPGDLNAVKVSF